MNGESKVAYTENDTNSFLLNTSEVCLLNEKISLKNKSDNSLKLCLNLASNYDNQNTKLNSNMTNSSTPTTPSGNIKVYINNITNSICKPRTASLNLNNNKLSIVNNYQKCTLDKNDCITLNSVLETFNSPISEEQAWAICFNFIITVQKFIKNYFLGQQDVINHNSFNSFHRNHHLNVNNKNVLNHHVNILNFDNTIKNFTENTSNLSELCKSNSNKADEMQIYLHKDGFVHENTLLNYSSNIISIFNEQELLMKFGLAIFQALDFKKDSDEELSISSQLENLIEKLTLEAEDKTDSDCKDNGFNITLDKVFEICYARLSSKNNPEFYCAKICKTLVIETIELSTFLHTIYEGTQIREKLLNENKSSISIIDEKKDEKSYLNNNHLNNLNGKLNNSDACIQSLHLAEWAKLWMQVLHELRSGNRTLKKVVPQIQSKQTFNTNFQNQKEIQRMNAHALILEYIRSRPALMPAKERKLAPPLKPQASLIEQLHECIKKQDIKLKPVQTQKSKYTPVLGRVCDNVDSASKQNNFISESANNSPLIGKKKLIKPDIDWDFDSDDDIHFCGKQYLSLF